MDTFEAIRKRASVREYSIKPLPKDAIEKIVDAGHLAPTARGEEPWEFIVVVDPKTKDKLAQLATNGAFIKEAPCCVAIFCKDTKYYLEDGCAATENMLIAATALGVASCWIAGDKKPYCSEVAKILGMPEGHRLISMITLGYPYGKVLTHQKRPLDSVIHWDKF